MEGRKHELFKDAGFRLILLLGIVALCGDIIYEGARSVTGPYLLLLGGSAALVGLVAGFGEFAGYALRLISGHVADRSGRYWSITILGYGMLLAVPLLAFTDRWEGAALLIILERIGKGIRSPAKDAILSHASKGMGRGTGFGIHEAMDQIGAIIGPLLIAAALFIRGGGIEAYQTGFLILGIPFLLLLAVLLYARESVPQPIGLEPEPSGEAVAPAGPLRQVLVPYSAFTFCTMAGFIAFPLIAYHLASTGIVDPGTIALIYALAMATDGAVALVAGRLYDRRGLILLAGVPVVNLLIPIALYLSAGIGGAVLAALLFGAAMGMQETILRAAIADLTPRDRRGTVYGIFNTVYGAGWLVGGIVIGLLYDQNLILLIIIFIAAMQLLALPLLRQVFDASLKRSVR
jgi:MFS family permease